MVFPDTSPRNVGAEEGNWTVGYGAGHYVNATAEPWKNHFNMYDYITKELPQIVETYFPVKKDTRSITGFSMGGGGALMIAARNPGMFKSVTAFAPIGHPTTSQNFCFAAFTKYFTDLNEAKAFDTVEVLNMKGKDLKLPPGFIDYASMDKWHDDLASKDVERALRENGHDMPIRWQEGYTHNPSFVTTFIGEHIAFHASKLN
jgi:S-formylglutathione hydrolase